MAQQAVRDGRALPSAIQNAPSLGEHEVFYFNAYQELCTCRQYEGGFIPWTAVKLYSDHYGLADDDFWILLNIINLTDLEVRKTAKPQQGGKTLGNNTP